MSTILIGVDATARSEDAIALGRRLARLGDSRLIVATVTSDRAEAHDTVRRMSGLLAGIEPERIHTAIVPGRSAAHGRHDLAIAEQATLLIVGSTHTGRLGRVRPGATGERLLLGAPCAVAVAPHGFRTRLDGVLERVGVAYDGSVEASAAFAAALALTRATAAQLEAVTVIPLEVYGTLAAAHAEVDAALREALARAVEDLPDAEGVVLEGRPWAALAAHSQRLDLLFVGSRGYGPLRAVITGGTSGPLLHHAHCPVVVLPRGVERSLAELFTPVAAAR
jgi:nucleotide-binding universal stress UspA family protein